MIYVPIVIFLGAILWAWTPGRAAGVNATRHLAIIAGGVGLASVAVSAYLIRDQSQKGIPGTTGLAVALLLAYSILFFALLLKTLKSE